MRNLVDADAEVIHGLAVAELQRVELALERVRLRLLHTSTLTYMVLIASHAHDRLRRYSFCDDLKCHTVLDVVVGANAQRDLEKPPPLPLISFVTRWITRLPLLPPEKQTRMYMSTHGSSGPSDRGLWTRHGCGLVDIHWVVSVLRVLTGVGSLGMGNVALLLQLLTMLGAAGCSWLSLLPLAARFFSSSLPHCSSAFPFLL